MRNASLLILLFFSSMAIADGWADLSGKNSKGENVGVYPAEPEYEWKNGVGLPSAESRDNFVVYVDSGDKTKIFDKQKCYFEEKNGERVKFWCSENGKSPLAGATYNILLNQKQNCDYYAKYICVQGCGNPELPKVMFKGHWECEE